MDVAKASYASQTGAAVMGNMEPFSPGLLVGEFVRPPWRAILLYAVQGWACLRGVPFEQGQRLPGRASWLPVFIRQLHQAHACQTIADYAVQGMRGDNLPPDLLAMVQRAMRRADALTGVVDALAGAAVS